MHVAGWKSDDDRERKLTASNIYLRMDTIKSSRSRWRTTVGLIRTSLRPSATPKSSFGMDGRLEIGWCRVSTSTKNLKIPLTRNEANNVLRAPVPAKACGTGAILAVLLSCGLMRAKLLRLKLSDLTQRDGGWFFADIVGKGNRTQTVTVPTNVKVAIDRWTSAGRDRRRISLPAGEQVDVVSVKRIKDEKVLCAWSMGYAEDIALDKLAPHDAHQPFTTFSNISTGVS